MISFLRGNIAEIDENNVIIDVANIGYEVNVTTSTLSQLSVGQEAKLHCYMQVREDAISLFGFSSSDEKKMFLRLITVSGIGCKVALNILSSINSQELAMSILNGDTATLSRIKGLGKKTAERLILELREKVKGVIIAEKTAVPSINSDAVSLLVSLGLSQDDATSRVEAATKLGANTTEQLINMSLRMG